ncbi:hypothetical protein [Plebeiibacterium sediminum]|uniref:Uncharacterized protein n=1 Tax=Plebeiibacterium sediminum TaxID=2992112 RepID=A0AAE3M0R5_9BACT|nr:hypothetical protein [Plebeiobacterium sediminum]MCW3784909.1 hypothetical protein [Plebeiobacterium sediminum]
MKKQYDFEYGSSEAFASFEVDTEIFTEKEAQSFLNFFVWSYDKEENPIDEAMRKYAISVIECATFEDWNTRGVIDEFNNKEGYYKVDGSEGITLKYVERYEFEEENLTIKVKEVQS